MVAEAEGVQSVPPQKPIIMVVDDQGVALNSLVQLMRYDSNIAAHYTVVGCKNANIAWEEFDKTIKAGGSVAAILTDKDMPLSEVGELRDHGIWLRNQVRESHPDIPIFLMTADWGPRNPNWDTYPRMFNHVFSKPIDIDKVIETVKNALPALRQQGGQPSGSHVGNVLKSRAAAADNQRQI